MTYPEDWAERSRHVRDRDGNRCSICGLSVVALHVHHKVPLAQGGSNDLSNLMTVCETCHSNIHGNSVQVSTEVISSGFHCIICDRIYSIEFGRTNCYCDICGEKLRPWFDNKRD